MTSKTATQPINSLQNPPRTRKSYSTPIRLLIFLGALLVTGVLVWQGVTSAGNPDPTTSQKDSAAAALNIGVLVFREGLECILVLAAITASMTGERQAHRRPVAAGVGVGLVATLATWFIAVRIIDDLAESIPALQLQAGTGLLAIVVLLIIMNWFFHKVYWTGWISAHNKKKRELTEQESAVGQITPRLLWGLGVLGFTSLYREGFEIVLFLQSYRLKMGATTVAYGVGAGLLLTAIVAVLTFIAHQRLPYRRMLVLTGVLLGVVLMVMVGEQVQEMQLAHWISQTDIPSLVNIIPDWMGLWFAVFPNVESLVAQLLAGAIVIGSYFYAERDVRAKHA